MKHYTLWKLSEKRFSVYSRNFCQLTVILKLYRAQDGTIKCKQGKAREISWDLLQRCSNWPQQNCYLKHLFNSHWILHSQLKCTKNPIFQMEQDMSGLYFCLNLVLEITPCCYFDCLNSDITYSVPSNAASYWKQWQWCCCTSFILSWITAGHRSYSHWHSHEKRIRCLHLLKEFSLHSWSVQVFKVKLSFWQFATSGSLLSSITLPKKKLHTLEKTITGRTTSQVIKQNLLFLPQCKKNTMYWLSPKS